MVQIIFNEGNQYRKLLIEPSHEGNEKKNHKIIQRKRKYNNYFNISLIKDLILIRFQLKFDKMNNLF